MSKHKPTNRSDFKAQALRKLGDGVIEINVSDDQIEDCIEEGLKYFTDYHYDGSEHVYYVHVVDQDNIDSRSIPVPANIIGVSDVYSLNSQSYTAYSSDMFGGGYQMAFEFAFSTGGGTMLTYYMNKVAYEFLNQMLIGMTPIRYNRHLNVVHIDFNWKKISTGSHIVLDATSSIDPDTNTDIWNDRWLIKYVTAKIKYIWGSNLSKYEGVQLPGGGTLNGVKIQDDAKEEIQALEDEMISTYSMPLRDAIG